MTLAMIGFGEAGQAFAAATASVRVYDRLTDDGSTRERKLADYRANSIDGVLELASALTGAEMVLSLVTADEALNAARAAAAHLEPGTLYFDMNSVAPATKMEAAAAIEAVGAYYADAAVMAPVNPLRLAVPILVSGPEKAVSALNDVGFSNVRSVGGEVGRASTIKMLRSVMYKGMEALTAECLIACHRAGVMAEVLASFGDDMASGADYRLDRMLVHGGRRSSEMYEAARTLHALGVSPTMTDGTVDWQQAMGELAISPVPSGLEAKLEAIGARMP